MAAANTTLKSESAEFLHAQKVLVESGDLIDTYQPYLVAIKNNILNQSNSSDEFQCERERSIDNKMADMSPWMKCKYLRFMIMLANGSRKALRLQCMVIDDLMDLEEAIQLI